MKLSFYFRVLFVLFWQCLLLVEATDEKFTSISENFTSSTITPSTTTYHPIIQETPLEHKIMVMVFFVCILLLIILALNFIFEMYRRKKAEAICSRQMIIGGQQNRAGILNHQYSRQSSRMYTVQHWPELPPPAFIPLPMTVLQSHEIVI